MHEPSLDINKQTEACTTMAEIILCNTRCPLVSRPRDTWQRPNVEQETRPRPPSSQLDVHGEESLPESSKSIFIRPTSITTFDGTLCMHPHSPTINLQNLPWAGSVHADAQTTRLLRGATSRRRVAAVRSGTLAPCRGRAELCIVLG